ncbi:MAG TPA: NUDIX domain-containing protein [Polyangiales bacterium]|nr:NUDIX domain-containing protein [Polyangiales bacterium]
MKQSAGMLMFRRGAALEVLLVHPGGPFFKNKDLGSWSLPKGELAEGEDPLACALREFQEETGLTACAPYLALGEIIQKGGKRVQAWAFDGSALEVDCSVPPPSNTFEIEWPPRSSKRAIFPEVDRLGLFDLAEAGQKILPAQAELLQRLTDKLALDSEQNAP